MPLKPDDMIINGKYHILDLIGEGAMARVWLAEEPQFGGRRVAIKEPLTGRLGEHDRQELEERFQQEINLAPQLERAGVPNVVRCYTLERLPGGTQLLVMEYVEGGSLSELLAKHPERLPIEQAVQIATDVLAALEGFHELPSAPVHRDVKPENILLDARGTARLADFGLAQLAGASGRSQLMGKPHPGTPMYMAPEQEVSPRALTPAADLYALGCVLFEMLTGQRYKRVRPGTGPSKMRPEVPTWLDAVLAHALEEEPWDRCEHAEEMSAMLDGPRVRRTQSGLAIATPENIGWLLGLPEPPGRVWWEKAGMELCLVPAGEFVMGLSEEEARRSARDFGIGAEWILDATPSHTAYLDAYYMARTPVTNGQYARFVRETGHRLPCVDKEWARPYNWDRERKEAPRGQEEHPVVLVSWEDAAAYCRWAGLRLPSEAEWEKAASVDARAGCKHTYPWGNAWGPQRCNSAERWAGRELSTAKTWKKWLDKLDIGRELCTSPVGAYSPSGDSPCGCADMAGNVWEWVADWYDRGFYARSSSRSAQGPESCSHRVQRGGSWVSGSWYACSAYRNRRHPDIRHTNQGFRCGLSPTSSSWGSRL